MYRTLTFVILLACATEPDARSAGARYIETAPTVMVIPCSDGVCDTAMVTISGSTTTTGVLALAADSFVGSMSVQTHLGYLGGVYDQQWPTVKARLLELGIRHIRERMVNNATVVNRTRDLAANGIRLTAGCWPENGVYTDAGHCLTMATAYGPGVIDAFDGWNEVDGGKVGTNWAPAWVAWQATLYQTIKNDPVWGSRPVLGNSLAHAASADQVANHAAILDYGNLHPYPGGNGMPSNVSASWVPQWDKIDGGKPDYATETGYHSCPTCTNGVGVSEQAQGKYAGRLWFEYWNRHIQRTNWYELIDEGVSTTDREKNWGLLRNDGSPKPAFTVTRNLVALLADPGPAFAPGRLDYALGNASAATHQTLLQKRDGRFYLVLWQEVSVWNVTSKADVANADRPVTLSLVSPAGVRVYRPSTDSWSNLGAGTAFAVAVPDEVVLVEVTP